ncbi:TIGR03857 family LLM class F420-dependent oxidoreductase [Aquihabitans sp. G128]|uniref:TIGR03857 family LLM class F420-dependent oxidoreductase n=1 Tax=Aquihabitans sp. G128 TaxID=2849779 RepID=UPI001C248146|nr:TIGR03857 family LLM class F420-dependent oxidoreductase [Aquihabitans sp. G128]QXC59586.1 TIGR03857 family LLM class F420-dependent oxidoreductase [Aquihabitans sp. G128]
MGDDALNELGFYVLAGGPSTPQPLRQEVVDAERVGLGSGFVSERYNVKEAVTLSAAAGALTSTLGVATAATNHNSRHPLVTASFATTMHRLTEGRFALGLGRGIAPLQAAYGLPPITTAQLEDVAGLLRRLWKGEAIFDHRGPAGHWPVLHLDSTFDEDIPLLLVAFGPQTLALAGRAFDAVVLHTFFTDETTANAAATVRRAAEEAGRDPDAVRIWSCYATVAEPLDEEDRLRRTVGRLATYLQGYGDLLVRTNGWDPAVLDRFRADEVASSVPGAIDSVADHAQLAHIATLIPDEWLAPAAMGTAEQCATAVRAQFDLGVDGVIMHGSTPAELEPVAVAYRNLPRPDGADLLLPNPGRPRS